jgi:AraC family L-rhamnose operon transcriptional activator RhaR/AraC family L-rhamnose operon regulatory protein RhaS
MATILKKKDFFGPDGFPIVVARREPQPLFPLHSHQFSELVIVTGGIGVHSIRTEQYPIAAGDVFVVNDDSPHEYRDMEGLSLVNILYVPSDLKMSSWDLRELPGYHALFRLEPAYRKRHQFESRLRIDVEDLTVSRNMVDELEHELFGRKPGFRLMATSIFMRLVAHLSRCYAGARQPQSRSLLRIGKAISHIEQNYNIDIDLETLSDIAHMSRRNFTRVFRESMGRSPIDYLIHVRVARAAELLRNEDCRITDIAFRVGFSDSNYFARRFRMIMGLSPADFREHNQPGF